MADPIAEFFDEIGRRQHEQYRRVEGSVRLDLARGPQQVDHWLLQINNGRMQVSRKERDADCVIRSDRASFERIVRGEVDLRSAWLRGQVKLVGSAYWLQLFRKLLPGPAGARDTRVITASER
ncbi:SCP2 sterol-binding domain-containing protein [Micromonospora sp. H33]|uniref:SCP2 sterol-binding domain-containing protein n=1 Tax=Micromonospora sp. H33 TaxID=3452215 RepID=UPI003F895922